MYIIYKFLRQTHLLKQGTVLPQNLYLLILEFQPVQVDCLLMICINCILDDCYWAFFFFLNLANLFLTLPSSLCRSMLEWRFLCGWCWELLLWLPPRFRRGSLWDRGKWVRQPALPERCHLPGLRRQLCVRVPTRLWWNLVWTQHPRMHWEVSGSVNAWSIKPAFYCHSTNQWFICPAMTGTDVVITMTKTTVPY